MKDEDIEKIINEEFDGILSLDDEIIKNMSFAESCVYLDYLNKANERMKELKMKK